MYLGIAFFVLAAFVPQYFCNEDIHHFMTPEEVQYVFHTNIDSVPKYEIAKVHVSQRLHKRGLPSGSHLHCTAFGENINLWIHPRDSILAGVETPVYYAKYSQSAPEGVEYRHQPGLMGMIGQIFEDPEKMASLVIGRDYTGRTRINGYVEAHRLAIVPLPHRVVEEYNRRRRSVEDPEHPQYSPYHIIIKMDESTKVNSSNSPVNETKIRQRLSRSVEEVPVTLYPEILVVAEHSVYTAFNTPQGHDIYGLLEYLLAFWNGVDLKYRSLDTPKFRFSISAIVLAEDVYATPYIQKHMVATNTFNTYKAMPEAMKFFYAVKDTFPLASYDIAATMTKYKFGINSGILGQAYPNSVCKNSDVHKTIDAVTIFFDDGVFSGVHNIAHELGHTFGANHDGVTEECKTQDGFLMAGTPWYTTNTSDFSPCSLKEIQNALDGGKLTCLYNHPKNVGNKLPKIIPGKMKNLDAQCKNLRGGSSCQHQHPEHSVCVNMFCLNDEGECVETGTAALDGTQCGRQNEFCLHMQCVSL